MSQAALVSKKASVGPGPWVPVRNPRLSRTFQVTVNGVATVSIEASNDGVNPVVLMPGISASAGYTDSDPWGYVRANVTGYTSGDVTVIMGDSV